jgi:rhamnulokinase
LAQLNLLACDVGASNGKTILASFDGESLSFEEIHKFANGGEYLNGNFHWDIIHLFQEIKTGIKKAVKITDGALASLGIDSWGVDYGLLDKQGRLMSLPFHYRDKRTGGIPEEVFEKAGREEIYLETGIQFMNFNTIFQLYADKKTRPWILENGDSLLFIPDLINYFLTGKKYNEQTIASTSQLYNPVKLKWADRLFEKLDIPRGLVEEIIYPGNIIGDLLPEIREECGVKGEFSVMAVGSHDTASAVAATPLNDEKSVYISSGTWLLLGMELNKPIINDRSLEENFTNELGVDNRIRFLKNITGLWLIQECKRIWDREGRNLSYSDISEAARMAKPFLYRLDPDDPVFTNPANMPDTIREYCRKSGQAVPESIGEVARGIYESLAFSCDQVINSLERFTDTEIETINMVGGGIKAELLCQYIADITGCRVLAGPVEATACGNALVQLMGFGEIKDLQEGRELLKKSIDLKEYLPSKNI